MRERTLKSAMYFVLVHIALVFLIIQTWRQTMNDNHESILEKKITREMAKLKKKRDWLEGYEPNGNNNNPNLRNSFR